jgi:protein-arginine kinase activator protein McsA
LRVALETLRNLVKREEYEAARETRADVEAVEKAYARQ